MSKTALITGATQGIGLGIAEGLVQKGYTVYVNGRSSERVSEVIKQLGSHAKPAVFDVCDAYGVTTFLTELKAKSVTLDLLVSNVGKGSIQDIRQSFDINFFSAVNLCENVLSLMPSSGGHIITISSIAGCESIAAPPVYTAAKAALTAYSKALSDSLAPKGIRVNTISPGNIMAKDGIWEKKRLENRESVDRYIQSCVPLKQFITPEDIFKGILFLEESPRITGCNLVIDGGQTRSLI